MKSCSPVCRSNGSRHSSIDSVGWTTDDSSSLVHSGHCGRFVDGGHVCAQWEVPQHGWAARRGVRSGVRLFSGYDSLTVCLRFWVCLLRDFAWILTLFLFLPKAPCSCRPLQRSGPVSTPWLFMEVWCCSACFCCTTHRKSSSVPRRTLFMAFRNMTPLMRKSFLWVRERKCLFHMYSMTVHMLPSVNYITVTCSSSVLWQMHGHLHGHSQHLHTAGDDSSQWRRKQKEVDLRRQRHETGLEKMMLLNKVLLIYFAFICLKAEKNVWIIFSWTCFRH